MSFALTTSVTNVIASPIDVISDVDPSHAIAITNDDASHPSVSLSTNDVDDDCDDNNNRDAISPGVLRLAQKQKEMKEQALLLQQQQQQRYSFVNVEAEPSAAASSSSRQFSFIEIDHPLSAAHNSHPLTLGRLEEEDNDDDARVESSISTTTCASPSASTKDNSVASSIASSIASSPSMSPRATTAPTSATSGVRVNVAMPPTANAPFASSSPRSPSSLSSSSSFSSSSSSSTPSASSPTTITMTRLVKLFNFFAFQYSRHPSTHRTSPTAAAIQHRVNCLARLDYHVSIIANRTTASSANGSNADSASSASSGPAFTIDNDVAGFEYCQSYPLDILIFENEKSGPFGVGELSPDYSSSVSLSSSSSVSQPALPSRINDASLLRPLFRLSRFSRVHGRFVAPVILVHNKNICRSSTLSIQAEAILNNVHAVVTQSISSFWDTISSLGGSAGASTSNGNASSSSRGSSASSPIIAAPIASGGGGGYGLEGQRGHDIQLLHRCGTTYVIDLMVEHRKKKAGFALTSSEKNEGWRYQHMKLNALPYPGCEFFLEYLTNGHSGLQLMFDWRQSFVSSDLLLSSPHPSIADDMLSCNGTLSTVSEGKSQSTLDREHAPWFEFQHGIAEHEEAACAFEEERKRRIAAQSNIETTLSELSSSSSSTNIDASSLPPLVASSSSDVCPPTQHPSAIIDSSPITAPLPSSSPPLLPSPAPVAVIASPVPLAPTSTAPSTSFSQWRRWDVVTMTKNYMLILLAHTADDSANSGLLVHCISGWDRTPLFVSLMRLSLWADGECHRSLSALQILYFTLAYDWCLFGHQLNNRLEKGEDVLYFCFDFLQYITNTKFSLNTAISMRRKKREVSEELHLSRVSPNPNQMQNGGASKHASSSSSSSSLSTPNVRKSHSDGSRSNSSLSPDEGHTSLLVDTSSSSIQPTSLARASSDNGGVPSLSSFIIESHGTDKRSSRKLSSSSSSVVAPPTPVLSDLVGNDSISPLPSSLFAPSSSSSSPDPLSSSTSASGTLIVASTSNETLSTATGMNRVNSWTIISDATSGKATAAPMMRTSEEEAERKTRGNHADGSNDKDAYANSNASSSSSPESASSTSSFSLHRCERLLEVRSLFMSMYHLVLPLTSPAAIFSPHSHATSHAAESRRAKAERHRERALVMAAKSEEMRAQGGADGRGGDDEVKQADSNDNRTNDAQSTIQPRSSPTLIARSSSAPVAVPVRAAPASSGRWF